MWQLFQDSESIRSAGQESSTVYSLSFSDAPMYLVRVNADSSTELEQTSSAQKKATSTQRSHSKRKSGK